MASKQANKPAGERRDRRQYLVPFAVFLNYNFEIQSKKEAAGSFFMLKNAPPLRVVRFSFYAVLAFLLLDAVCFCSFGVIGSTTVLA